MNFLQNIHNAIDYPLRQFFRWRRKGLSIPNQSKNTLFDFLPPAENEQAVIKEAYYRKIYHLEEFYQNSHAGNYRETLYYLEMLEQALHNSKSVLPDHVSCADIGPSHWFYVQGLHACLRWYQAPDGRSVQLTGFETDAYRLYNDFRSRADHAIANIRSLANVEYLPQAFSSNPAQYDLVIMFFPFVFIPDHLQWGLPGRMFNPVELLTHAWQSLRTGGTLVIANQGEKEHSAQRLMLESLSIPIKTTHRFESLFFKYTLPRYIITACHD